MKTGISILCILLSEVVFSQDHATIKIGASSSNRNFVDLVAAMDYGENYFRYTAKPVETNLLSLGIGSRFIERFTTVLELDANIEGGMKVEFGSLRIESQNDLNTNSKLTPYFQMSLYTEAFILTDKMIWLGLEGQFSQGRFTLGRYFEGEYRWEDDRFIETQFRMRSIQVDALLRFHFNEALRHALTISGGFCYGVSMARKSELDKMRVTLIAIRGNVVSFPIGVTYSYFIPNKLDRMYQ